VYFDRFAPLIQLQRLADLSQRSHLNEKRVGVFAHRPRVARSVLPTTVLPIRCGSARFAGARRVVADTLATSSNCATKARTSNTRVVLQRDLTGPPGSAATADRRLLERCRSVTVRS
jgi:hypothetical protein